MAGVDESSTTKVPSMVRVNIILHSAQCDSPEVILMLHRASGLDPWVTSLLPSLPMLFIQSLHQSD